MIRSMMYAAALYGAKGLQNFTVTGSTRLPGDGRICPTEQTVLLYTGEKGEFFEQQKEIHAEFKNLGNTLMALTNTAVYHSSELEPYGKYREIYKSFQDDIAQSRLLAGELPARTSVGELVDDYGNNYLFVLNRDFYRKLNAEIMLKGRYHVYEVSRKDGRQYLISENADRIVAELQEGDAYLLRLQPAEEEPYTVSYVLNEG